MTALGATIVVGLGTSPAWAPSGEHAKGTVVGADTNNGKAPQPLAPGSALNPQGGIGGGGAAGPEQAGGPSATPSAANEQYDTTVTLACDLGVPVRRGGILIIKPHVMVVGNADPSRVVTVADFATLGSDTAHVTATYVGRGIGAEVDVPIPGNFGFPQNDIYVSAAYYAPGTTMPTTPEGFSNTNDTIRPSAEVACGNAAVAWTMANGGVHLPVGG